MINKSIDNLTISSSSQRKENHETHKISNGIKQLIGFSYWSFGLGFGPFIALVAAWVFRKNRFLHHQLIQAGVCQSIFYVLSVFLFGVLVFHAYNQPQTIQTSAFGIFIFALKGLIDWGGRIILFIISLICFRRGYIYIPFFNFFADKFISLFERKSLKQAIALSILWPGTGHLYIGKSWFGWILVFSHLVTACSLGYLLLAFYKFAIAKDFLTIMGFYLRIGDKSFQEGFIHPWSLTVLGIVFVLNYFIAIVNLPIKGFINKVQRTYFASLSSSYIIHIGVMWCILLLPFVLNSKASKQTIEKQAEVIYKKLKRLEEKKKEVKIKPNKNTDERIINFDLELTNKIEGTNQFSSKPFSQETFKDQKVIKTPTIGFSERITPLPPKKQYVKELSRDSKSYSEYLTAKVRESGRDQIIWDKAPDFYSVVLQYTVSQEGNISDIQIVEGSGELKMDALVISVIQSMSPLIEPQNKKNLQITELFWNTGGIKGLNTELKKSLATYPDGRVIEELN